MKSVAYAFNGIVLFNNYVEKDSKVKAIRFYANSDPGSFQLKVKILILNEKKKHKFYNNFIKVLSNSIDYLQFI